MAAKKTARKKKRSGYWNHRVMRHIEPTGEVWFGVHEVHYDGAGVITGWTERAASAFGETAEELATNLDQMREAFKQPVLAYDDAAPVTKRARSRAPVARRASGGRTR